MQSSFSLVTFDFFTMISKMISFSRFVSSTDPYQTVPLSSIITTIGQQTGPGGGGGGFGPGGPGGRPM